MSSNIKKNDGRTKIIKVSTHDQNFRRENFIHENYYNFFIRTCMEKKVIPQNAASVEKLEELHLGDVAEIIREKISLTFAI